MAAAITPSFLIGRARAMLSQALTGEVDFNHEDFLRCLTEVTLPTFSIYMPHLEKYTINAKNDRVYSDMDGIYQINTDLELLGVSRVLTGLGTFGHFPYDPMLYGDVLDRQLVANPSSASEVSLTFSFEPPNIVEIFPKGLYYDDILIEIKVVHPSTLHTVFPGSRETLTDLFLADVALDVLGIRNYFSTVNSAFGEINLNIDRLSKYADKRENIIEKLETKQLKYSPNKRIFIA
jgi:hypothetical protein